MISKRPSILQKKKEYLTEAQNKENGNALLIDIDMRFSVDTEERQYSITEISDIIQLYAEGMQELFDFKGSTVWTLLYKIIKF